MLDIAFAKSALPKSGALVLLIGEGEMPSGLWQQADEATGGVVGRALKAAEFNGAKGKICTILAPGAGLSRVVAVGLGKPAELSMHTLNEAGGMSAAAVLREVVLDPLLPASERVRQLGLGDCLPAGFDAWFERCVDRFPEKRFPDAAAAFEALARLPAPTTSAASWTSPTPPRSRRRQRRSAPCIFQTASVSTSIASSRRRVRTRGSRWARRRVRASHCCWPHRRPPR